uniref:Uncharacterized protein n=1 Tax=viral metagenome TaxID=1070528 RepID=A0A6H1ZF17_9ZZZZ
MDAPDGGPSGVHGKGFLHSRHEVRVGTPAGGGVRGAVASFPNNKRLTNKTDWRDARDATVLLDQVTQAALDIYRKIDQILLVFVINEGFEDATFRTLGDVIVEGVEGVAEATNFGAVEGGVIHVAGKSVVFPDDDAQLGAAAAEEIHELVKGFAANDGGAAAGFVLEDTGEEEVVLGSPGAQGGFLLGDGEVLVFVAGVTQVGEEGGAGRERGSVQ